MLTARLLDVSEVPWTLLDAFEDRTIFQTREWLNFIAESQRAVPIVAEFSDGGRVAGYFSGLIINRFGVRILGSPFPGWTTPYIGFNLVPGVGRAQALHSLERLAFGPLRCLHMEVSDPHFDSRDSEGLGFVCRAYESYVTDLRQTEEQIFGAMSSACRRCIRKAEKNGVVVQEANDAGFADEYYTQLQDVFAKQKLAPTYGIERVRCLVKYLLPTGRLLLLRALSPDGKCIGTGVYPGFNKVAQFWGNASYRETQILRPNETMHWHAIRYWKARGIETFDWGGGGKYKEKYGSKPLSVPWFYKSRYRLIGVLREQAKKAVRLGQVLAGRMGSRTAPAEEEEG